MTIGEIEDLLIDRIKGALPYLGTVESYNNQLEGDLQECAFRFPAVFAVLRGVRQGPSEFGGYEAAHDFDLLVVAKNLRGQAEARRGNRGAYGILDDLRSALADYQLEARLQPCIPGKVEALVMDRTGVMYGLELTVTGFFEKEES